MEDKARENRLRRAARRHRKILVKSRLRDRWAPDYGLYVLIPDNAPLPNERLAAQAFRRGESMTLDQIDETLYPNSTGWTDDRQHQIA